jgi:hypothetical protein
MLGLGHATGTAPWSAMLPNDVACAIVAGAVGATGLMHSVYVRLEISSRAGIPMALAWNGTRIAGLALIWYGSALTLDATVFNPFIYFRF